MSPYFVIVCTVISVSWVKFLPVASSFSIITFISAPISIALCFDIEF